MLVYKITAPGLVATKGEKGNFQLQKGFNETPKANCRRNGYHCAENPLDCLNYYPDVESNEIYLCSAGGDIDEDEYDSKISCTELTIIRQLSIAEFVAAALLYIRKYPNRPTHSRVKEEAAAATGGFGIAKGKNPKLKAEKVGDVLGFVIKTANEIKLKVLMADGERIKPGVWYTADGKEFLKNE